MSYFMGKAVDLNLSFAFGGGSISLSWKFARNTSWVRRALPSTLGKKYSCHTSWVRLWIFISLGTCASEEVFSFKLEFLLEILPG